MLEKLAVLGNYVESQSAGEKSRARRSVSAVVAFLPTTPQIFDSSTTIQQSSSTCIGHLLDAFCLVLWKCISSSPLRVKTSFWICTPSRLRRCSLKSAFQAAPRDDWLFKWVIEAIHSIEGLPRRSRLDYLLFMILLWQIGFYFHHVSVYNPQSCPFAIRLWHARKTRLFDLGIVMVPDN